MLQIKISDAEMVSGAISRCALQFLGEMGAAKAGIVILNNKWDAMKQRGIMKVSHKHVDDAKASFIFAKKIGGKDAIIRSLGVSGVLKKAENNYLLKDH